MQSHSLKPPDSTLQAPNIFIVPPEEDNSAPWCCFDAAQCLDDPQDDYRSAAYVQVPSYIPYLHTSVSGLESPRMACSSETRSIVDALGDAHDYPDHEGEQGTTDTDLEEDEDDGIESEVEVDYGPDDHHGRRYQRGQSEAARLQQQEIGNDSDVIEVIKVRRHSGLVKDTDGSKHGPSGNGNNLNSKLSFRSRATQALRSLRRTIRSTSTSSAESIKSLSRSTTTKSKSSLNLRKLKSHQSSQARDIFPPTESAPLSDRPNTPDLLRRPSSRLSQLFSPTLRRRLSAASFSSLASPTEPSAPFSQSHEPVTNSSASLSISRRSSTAFNTPSRRSSESTQARRESIYQGTDDIATPTRKSYQHQPEEDEPTPSWRISIAHREAASVIRSTSLTPVPRSISPTPSHRQASRRFSGLSLHKIFHKSSSNVNSESPPLPATSVSPATSTCPSLSSASTDESSGRATPTLDSSPQTPTSLDGNEVRQRTVPAASRSTLGGGTSPRMSVHSGAVSSLYSNAGDSAATVVTRASTSSRRVSISTVGSGNGSQRDSQSFGGGGSIVSIQQPRTSITSITSATSRSTTDSSGSVLDSAAVGDDLAASSPSATSRIPGLDIKLELDRGLGINLAPSSSGGLLSSNGMTKPKAKTNHCTRSFANAKPQGGNTITRSLSLKNLSSKLGLGGAGKQQANVPPVPPVPGLPDPVSEEADVSLEMRLDSLHFDDLSFDADNFSVR